MIENVKQEKATQNSWKNLMPFKGWKTRITLNRKFSNEEFKKLSFGLIPKTMDDHWFVYFEDNTLYFHRSWTGVGIYKIRFVHEENLFIPKEVRLNRFNRRALFYSFLSNNFNAKLILFLIEAEILEKNVLFPIPNLIEKILPNKYLSLLNSEVAIEKKENSH